MFFIQIKQRYVLWGRFLLRTCLSVCWDLPKPWLVSCSLLLKNAHTDCCTMPHCYDGVMCLSLRRLFLLSILPLSPVEAVVIHWFSFWAFLEWPFGSWSPLLPRPFSSDFSVWQSALRRAMALQNFFHSFKNYGGRSGSWEPSMQQNVFVAFHRSVARHHPASEFCWQLLWAQGLVWCSDTHCQVQEHGHTQM